MVLNGQQFSEVVSYLRDKVAASMAGSEAAHQPDGSEEPHHHHSHSQWLGGDRVSVLTRDISLEGIGLLAAVPIAKGEQFIALFPRSETETVFVLCETMYVAVVADGMFTLGCRFVKVLCICARPVA